MKTKQEKVVAFLLKRGCIELPSTSKKYRKFSHINDKDSFYFVGNKGALRAGKNISDSISLRINFNKVKVS